MPIFNYKCEFCGREYERFVRKLDETQRCSVCYTELKQVLSLPSPAQWACSKGSL